MCIIAAKKANIPIPTNLESLMRACFNSNHDGAGFMYKRQGENVVHVSKGFMTFYSFWEAFKRTKLTDKDEFVCHFRISTSGGISPEMTHPFIVDKNKDKIKSLYGKITDGMAMCHNGCMTEYVDRTNHPDMSDTALFVYRFLYKYKTVKGRDVKRWRKTFKKATSYQKMAFMYSHSPLELLGRYFYYNGMFFSTTAFSSWRSYSAISTGYPSGSSSAVAYDERYGYSLGGD